MEVEKIGTNSLDLELEKFLTPFKKDGRDAQYGVLLVKRMEKSRPRPANGPPGPYQHPNLEVTTYKATERLNLAGVFTLISASQLDPNGWLPWLTQLRNANNADIGLEDFIALMKFVAPFGNQCPLITMSSHSNPGLRPDLGIKQNPVAGADAAFRAKSNSKEFQSPWTQVNSMGSPVQIQTIFARLTLTVYHHRGQPFRWIVVPPNQKLNLEAAIRREFRGEIGEQECAQFANHLSIWITPERLRLWKINFYEVTQNKGNLLFLFPASYFWGFSSGYNVLEWKYHAGEDWNCSTYNFCDIRYPLCGMVHQAKPPLFVQAIAEQGLAHGDNAEGALVPALKRRKRPRKSAVASPSFETVMDFSDLYSNTSTTGRPNMAPTGHQDSVESNPQVEGQNTGNQDSVAYRFSNSAENQLLPLSSKDYILSLLQENQLLGQDNQRLQQQNQDLRRNNNELAQTLHQRAKKREAELRNQVVDASSQRDDIDAMLLKRDNTIRAVQVDLREASQNMSNWKAAALKGFGRVSELEKLLAENDILVPRNG